MIRGRSFIKPGMKPNQVIYKLIPGGTLIPFALTMFPDSVAENLRHCDGEKDGWSEVFKQRVADYISAPGVA